MTRVVSAMDLLQLVNEGGSVTRAAAPDAPAPVLDLSELVTAISKMPRVELDGLVEAVRGVKLEVNVPAPEITVNTPAPSAAQWKFEFERNQRGQIVEAIATPMGEGDA